MGFLERLGLVEEIPVETEIYEMEATAPVEEQIISVEFDNVNTGTLIEDIYAQNELFDKSKSIFKVEEMMNTLPKEMVTDVKRNSVISTLGIFGLTATQVTEDGESRIAVLNSVKEKINNDSNDVISKKSLQIEEYKQAIADLEKEIMAKQNETKSSNESIDNEVNRIKELVKFVGGTN